MNTYLLIKWLHIVSATVLFGTGIGIAYFKWMVDRVNDVRAIKVVMERTVLADWLFTAPAVIVQLLSGLWLAHAAGYSLLSHWLAYSLFLYFFAGSCWLPAVWLQIRMRDMARKADVDQKELPHQYWRYARIWFWLGVLAFIALITVLGLMVFRPA